MSRTIYVTRVIKWRRVGTRHSIKSSEIVKVRRRTYEETDAARKISILIRSLVPPGTSKLQ